MDDTASTRSPSRGQLPLAPDPKAVGESGRHRRSGPSTIRRTPRRGARPRARHALLLFLLALIGCVSRSHNGGSDDAVAGEPPAQRETTGASDQGGTGEPTTPAGAPRRTLDEWLAPLHDEESDERRALDQARDGKWKGVADSLATLDRDSVESVADAEALLLRARAHQEQGDADAALQDYAVVATSTHPLAPYAAVFAAELTLELDDNPSERVRLLLADVPRTFGFSARAEGAAGRALLRAGDSEGAARALGGDARKLEGDPGRLALGALAEALETQERWADALDANRTLVSRFDGSDEARTAAKAIERLEERVEVEPPPTRTPMEEARGLYRRHRSEQAIDAFDAIVADTDPASDPELWCEARYLTAKSWSKLRKHDVASGHYDDVIDTCVGETRRDALYNAGRAHWNAGRTGKAIERFRTLIDDFPTASLADDAYLYIARIQLEHVSASDAEKSLREQLGAYPDGDMAKDAHWLLFRRLYEDPERLGEAVAYVETVGEHTGEDDLYSQGRLAYFRGRALERLDRREEAIEAFRTVVQTHPLGFYAMLAFGRLDALTPDVATELLASLRPSAHDPERDALSLSASAVSESSALERALAAARIGEHGWTVAELSLIDLGSAPSEVAWVRAALLANARSLTAGYRAAAGLLEPEWLVDGEARARWSLAYPRPWRGLVSDAAAANELPWQLVYSIMREESGFNPRIESWANARGLMQLMLPTARSMAKRAGVDRPDASDLFEPRNSIPLGAAYLGKLAGLYDRHPAFVVAGYNGGQGNVNRWLDERGDLPLDLWIESIPYGQTRHYTKRVLMTFSRYSWLYDDEGDGRVEIDGAAKAGALAGRD